MSSCGGAPSRTLRRWRTTRPLKSRSGLAAPARISTSAPGTKSASLLSGKLLLAASPSRQASRAVAMWLAVLSTLTDMSWWVRGTGLPFTLMVNSRCSASMGSVRGALISFLQRRKDHPRARRQVPEAVEAVGPGHLGRVVGVAVDRRAQGGEGFAGMHDAHVGEVGG